MSRPAARERAGVLLGDARLGDYADQPVHVLSRGQKQRLGLARAVVHDPEVLILDEPAAGLDPRSRVELRDRLRRLARAGAAVIVSSHLLGDLEELADRVVFVDRGATVGQHRLDDLPTRTAARPWRLRALDPDALVAALPIEHEVTPAGVDVLLAGDRTRTDRIWWLLAPNPFVVVADAAPRLGPVPAGLTGLERDAAQQARDLDVLGSLGTEVRRLRLSPEQLQGGLQSLSNEEYAALQDSGGPVWPYGLAFDVLLAVGALVLTARRLRTPTRTLPKGQRVA